MIETVQGKQLQVDDALFAHQHDGKGGSLPIFADSIGTQSTPFWLHLNHNHQTSADWLAQTPLVPDSVRDALTGQSSRPRITRLGDGTFITLRSINFDNDKLPNPLVTLCIYLTDKLIISTRDLPVISVDQMDDDLKVGVGPTSSGDWLVKLADNLTDQASEFIDDLHDQIIELEDALIEGQIPESGKMALIRKQLIILRRYLLPQRDVFSRLAIDKLAWMADDDRHRMQDIADRLGRGLDDLDASIARTTVLSDEVSNLMSAATNRRTYTMSVLALLFLPASFLTGLFGVNLGGMPATQDKWAFASFCGILILIAFGIGWWLKRSKWV